MFVADVKCFVAGHTADCSKFVLFYLKMHQNVFVGLALSSHLEITALLYMTSCLRMVQRRRERDEEGVEG